MAQHQVSIRLHCYGVLFFVFFCRVNNSRNFPFSLVPCICDTHFANFSFICSFFCFHRDGHLDASLKSRYSKELVEMLHLLTHPDPQVSKSPTNIFICFIFTLLTFMIPLMWSFLCETCCVSHCFLSFLQTRPSAQALYTSLLYQYYPGTNANKLFPNNSGNSSGKNSSGDSASGVSSELERVLEENRRLKQQLGLR